MNNIIFLIENEFLYENIKKYYESRESEFRHVRCFSSFYEFSTDENIGSSIVLHCGIDETSEKFIEEKSMMSIKLTSEFANPLNEYIWSLKIGAKKMNERIMELENIDKNDSKVGIKLVVLKNEELKKTYLTWIQKNSISSSPKSLVMDFDLEFKKNFKEHFSNSSIFYMRILNFKEPDFSRLYLSNTCNAMYLRLFANESDLRYFDIKLLESIKEKALAHGIEKIECIVTSDNNGLMQLLEFIFNDVQIIDSEAFSMG